MKLIEASFAQLFLVAVQHCTERLGGRDPDVILRQGSPVNNNPLEYQPHRRRAPLRGSVLALPLTKHPFSTPAKTKPAPRLSLLVAGPGSRALSTVILSCRQPPPRPPYSGVTRQRKHRFDTFGYSKMVAHGFLESGFAYLSYGFGVGVIQPKGINASFVCSLRLKVFRLNHREERKKTPRTCILHGDGGMQAP